MGDSTVKVQLDVGKLESALAEKISAAVAPAIDGMLAQVRTLLDRDRSAAAEPACTSDPMPGHSCRSCGRVTCNGSCGQPMKSYRAKLLQITPQLVLDMLSGMTPTDEPGRMVQVCYRNGGDDLPAGAVCEAVRVNDRGDIEMRVEHDSFPVHEPGMMLDPVEPQYSAIDVPWSLLTLVRDMPISAKELLNAAADSLDRYATDRNAYAKAAAMCRDAAERSVKPTAIEPLGPSPLLAAPPAFAAKEAMDRAMQSAFGVPSQQVTGRQEVLFLGGPSDGRRKMVAAPLPRLIGAQFGTYEFTGGLAAGAFVYSFCDDTPDNIEAVKRVEKMANQAISERHGPFADVASLVPGVDYAKTAEPTPQVRGQHDGRTINVVAGAVQADEPTTVNFREFL